jgi:type I restriction enzyme, S subunit
VTDFMERSCYSRRRLAHVAEVQLGKMLQTAPASPADVEVPYMRAGHLSALPDELPTMWASPAETARYAVDAGDLLVAEGGDVGRPEFVPLAAAGAIIQNSLHRVRPRDGVDRRYLRYVLLAVHGSDWLDVLCNRSTFGHLTVEKLSALQVPVPTPDCQRAIADFLDAKTARIDALVARKRRMTDLLDERRADAVETAVRDLASQHGTQPLKRAVKAVTVGIVVTPSEWYSDHGVVALRGLNVRPGSIDLSDVVYLTDDGHRLHRKSELNARDVVVVRTGQAGAAAVVPDDLQGANCIDLLLIRPWTMDSHFLSFVLNSDWTQKHIASHSVGSIQAHFNVGALRELPVPAAPLDAQVSAAEKLQAGAVQHMALVQRLHRQIALLQEHRHALITAAVTGDLEVPGVAA